jgi:hypothetical protein
MATVINFVVEIDEQSLQSKLNALTEDKSTMLEVHNVFAKMCDPYVPFLEGPLSQSGLANVTQDYVQYGGSNVPYARYQYYGTKFNHTVDYHPLATAFWDKAMMRDKGDVFKQEVTEILRRRAQQLYG